MTDLKTPDDWLASPDFAGVTILDPDGWDRKNFEKSWSEPIDRDEMERRMCISTVQIMPDSPHAPTKFCDRTDLTRFSFDSKSHMS